MRLSVHTDVLLELASSTEGKSTPCPKLKSILEDEALELWSPMLCVADADRELRSKGRKESIQELHRLVTSRISTVPLRRTTLTDCVPGDENSLQTACHASVHDLVPLDAILSRTAENNSGEVPWVSPEGFEALTIGSESDNRVPFLDLKAQYSKVYNDFDDRLMNILSTSGFVLGPQVDEFEQGFARLQGAKYCVGLSTGTDALHVAFEALGIGAGDEVLVPVNTFIATAEGVSLAGATPVLVDSDEYFNIDVNKARKVLEDCGGGTRIRAIAPVHLYGQPADMQAIRDLADEFDLAIVEDCAQAHLARYRGELVGNFGEFGTFSFYPGKNLGAYGEAGAVVTNDEALYERARMYRAHGEGSRYVHSIMGHNYRMEAIQGAVLSSKLNHIEEWTGLRQRNAALYSDLLGSVDEIQVPREAASVDPVYHLYVIQAENRDTLRAYLDSCGIATGLHYPIPLHLQDAYRSLGYEEGDFPIAERQAARALSLPMYPELTTGQIKNVCNAIKNFYSTS